MPLLSLISAIESPYSIDYSTQRGLSITNTDNSGSTVAMIFPQLKVINNTKFTGAIETYVIHPFRTRLTNTATASTFHPSSKRETYPSKHLHL